MSDLRNLVKSIKTKSHLSMRVMSWLSANDELRVTTKAGNELLDSIVGVKDHTRAGRFHASSSGQCMRRQMLEYLGADADSEVSAGLRAIFHDGHFRHLRWQLMLLEAGILDVVEHRFSLPEMMLTGSVDGLNTDEEWIFELKGTSQIDKVKRDGPMPAHIRQVHAYFLLTGYERAIIVYDNKSNQTFEEFEINLDHDVLDEVAYEFETLTKHVVEGKFPEMLEPCKHKHGIDYERCPYTQVCPHAETVYEIQPA